MCVCVVSPSLHPRLIPYFQKKKKGTWTEQLCFPSLSLCVQNLVTTGRSKYKKTTSCSSSLILLHYHLHPTKTQQQLFSLLLSLSEPNQRRLRLHLHSPFINALLPLFLLYFPSFLSLSRSLFLSFLYNHPRPI